MKINENDFVEHCSLYDGYCTACDSFTRDGDTEPDARKYPCPACGGRTAMGAEEALLMGYIEIE